MAVPLAALTLLGLAGVPPVAAGDDLPSIIVDAVAASAETLRPGDVVMLAQKIVSKAEGRIVDLRTIEPSARAIVLARQVHKDPRLVELILAESSAILRVRPGVIVVEHVLGHITANAGIDHSNVAPDSDDHTVLMLPRDPDASAKRIRDALLARTGIDLPVVVIDSVGRAWRNGTVGHAIGVSGMPGLVDLRGRPDFFGRTLQASELGLADELAAAASIVMGQAAEGRPVVLARGVPYARREGSARELLRPKAIDLFR